MLVEGLILNSSTTRRDTWQTTFSDMNYKAIHCFSTVRCKSLVSFRISGISALTVECIYFFPKSLLVKVYFKSYSLLCLNLLEIQFLVSADIEETMSGVCGVFVLFCTTWKRSSFTAVEGPNTDSTFFLNLQHSSMYTFLICCPCT